MSYAINTNTVTLAEWNRHVGDYNIEYQLPDLEPSSIVLHAGTDEMLRVAPDGFYVRGARVPADEHEAQAVYLAFKQWLAWANLQRR